MWKISIYADDTISSDDLEVDLRFLADLGFEYIDPRLFKGKNLMYLSDEEVSDLQKLLKKYNLKVGGLGSPIFKCPLRGFEEPIWGDRHGYDEARSRTTGNAYEEHLKLLERAFRIADRLGAVNVRCFAFWRQYRLDDVFDEVVEKLSRAVRMAEKSGHMLGLENEHNLLAATGIEAARLIKAIDSPNFTCIYDAGNSWRRGGTPFPDDMDALRGLVSHLHVKHESVDVVVGNNSYNRALTRERELGGLCLQMYGSWERTPSVITGRLNINGLEVDVTGDRNIIPIDKLLFVDHAAILRRLKENGYKGLIAIDNKYRNHESEKSVTETVNALRKVIADIWEKK